MKRYFCESCCSRYDSPGDCTKCPDEPLLDLSDHDVIQMLQDFDDARLRKKAAKFTLGLAIVCAPLLIGFAMFFSKWVGLIVYGGAVSGGTTFLLKKFPAEKKCPETESMNFTLQPNAG